jgi:hypothetical protein
MSVTNLAYSASYGSGGWLYDHGMSIAPLRGLQHALFGIGGGPTDKLSLNVLILIGAVAYFASFIAVHLLPDRAATVSSDGQPAAGPERWLALPSGLRRAINLAALALGGAVLGWLLFRWKMAPVSSVLLTFLGMCLVRKAVLDALLRRRRAAA